MVHFLGNYKNTKQTSVYFGDEVSAQSLSIRQFQACQPVLGQLFYLLIKLIKFFALPKAQAK